ncbi:MAG: hypothetical protein ACX93T_00435 [Bacteroidota bacterium]
MNKNGRRSDKYYPLSKLLQAYIQNKSGLDLDFSSDGFAINDEEALVKRRHRK